MDAAIAAARTKGAQVLWVEGEAGIGKTHLVQTARRRGEARGVRVLSARAEELDGRRPFGLILDLLALPCMPDPPPPAQASLPAGSGPAGPDLGFSMSERAIEAMEHLCGAGPVLMILEDLHWADPGSLHALLRVLTHTHPLPLVTLGTFRPIPRPAEMARLVADGPVARTRRIRLQSLDPDEVQGLAETSLDARVGPALRERLGVAGGNPLFVLEMLDALQAEGAIGFEGCPGEPNRTAELRASPVLSSLRGTILRRLQVLSPEDREVLKLGAVLGSRFQPEHLSLIRNDSRPQLSLSLEHLLAAGLLTQRGDSLSFRHDLIRDALYEEVPQAITAALHREFAEVLDRAGARPELVAEHALRGTMSHDASAGRLLVRLGHDLSASSPLLAVDLLRRALSHGAVPPDEVADHSAEMGILLLLVGRVEEGEAVCRDALAHPLAPGRQAAVSVALASSLLRRGRAAEARSEAQTALAKPGMRVLRDQVRLEGVIALADLFLGDYASAQARAKSLEASGALLEDVALGTRARVLGALVLAGQGRAGDAAEHAKTAVRIADRHRTRELQEGNPHLVRAMGLMDTDRFTAAAGVLGRGVRIQEETGASSTLALHQVGLGFVYFWSGRWERACSELETGLALARETGTGWRVAALGLLAVVALAGGDARTAAEHLDVGARCLRDGEAPYRTQWWHWARMLVRDEDAHQRADLGWLATIGGPNRVLPDPLAFAPLAPTTVRMALDVGERALATRLTHAVRALVEANPGARGIEASALAAQGLLAQDPDLMDRALDRFRQAGRLLELGLAAEEASVLAARLGQPTRARQHLETASTAYLRLGAPNFAQRASRRLGSYLGPGLPGVIVRPRPSRGWGALTATEYRVVRLVAERRSNADIAGILRISRRTVETHVSHALAKVDLETRIELAEQAARHFHWRLLLDESRPHEVP